MIKNHRQKVHPLAFERFGKLAAMRKLSNKETEKSDQETNEQEWCWDCYD
jgi:hypothetical protein